MLEAGLFESKIRIRYACVHLGRLTKEISSSHYSRSSIMLICFGVGGCSGSVHFYLENLRTG
jgi:hypothetical protein